MVEDADTRLDRLSLKVLELMQEIVQLKLQLQECMKIGSINLAKSRYIMGNRNVSASQLPTEDSSPFRALCKVDNSKSDSNDVESYSFTLLVEEPVKKQKVIRNDKSTGELHPSGDPLHWFGVLVPQNLRVAQQSFKEAIGLSVQIANSQAHLETLRLEFCTLKLEQVKLS